jgi:hypothetical protein
MARNGEIVLIDERGPRACDPPRALWRVIMLFGDGAKVVSKGDRSPSGIRTPAGHHRKAGQGEVSGPDRRPTMTEQVDEATGIAQRVVTETGVRQPRQEGRPASAPDPARRRRAAKRRATCSRSARCCRSRTGRRSRPATFSPVSRAKRQDPRHHRRSAARCRTVRSARPKDNAIIAKIDGRDRIRPRLQEQAPHRDRARGRRRSGRIPDPEGQAHRRAGRRLRREGRLPDRRQSRRRTTSSKSGRRGAGPTSSTKSRKSIVCRA